MRWDRVFLHAIETAAAGFGAGFFLSVLFLLTTSSSLSYTSAFTYPVTQLFVALGFGIGFLFKYEKERDVEETQTQSKQG